MPGVAETSGNRVLLGTVRAVTVSVYRTQSLRLDNYLRVIARLMSPEPEGLVWVLFFLMLKERKKKTTLW